MKTRAILLLAATLCLSSLSRAAGYLVDMYSTDDGLSNNYINYILKDSEGYMWLGTWDGLSRMDGYVFRSYDSFHHPELRNSRVQSIRETFPGYLWITTHDRALYLFDKAAGQYIPVGLPEGFRYSGRIFPGQGSMMLWDDEGTICEVMADPANGTVTEVKVHRPAGAGANIHFLTEIPGGVLAGTSAGLMVLRDGQWLGVPSGAGVAATCFCTDPTRSGALWLGTQAAGIFHYDPSSGIPTPLPGSRACRDVAVLQIAGVTTLMAGSSASGLWLFDLGSGRVKVCDSSNTPALTSDRIVRITKEDENRYWITTSEPGIVRYDAVSGLLRHYSLPVRPTAAVTSSIVRKYAGKVILNSYRQGLAIYDPATDRMEHFHKEMGLDNALFSQSVHHLMIDEQDNIWISPWSRKLYKVSPPRNTVERLRPQPGSQLDLANEIRALGETRSRQLWVGMRDWGALCYDEDGTLRHHIQSYTGADGRTLPLRAVYSINPRPDGGVWLGTKGGGIVSADGQSGRARSVWPQAGGDDNVSVYAMAGDAQGRIWLATFEHGLVMLFPTSAGGWKSAGIADFASYPRHHRAVRTLVMRDDGQMWVGTTDGLLIVDTSPLSPSSISVVPAHERIAGLPPFSDVHALLEDSRGGMWIGATGCGLTSIDKSCAIKRYSTADGLPNNSVISLCEGRGGEIWIATEDDICRFTPQDDKFYTFTRTDGFSDMDPSENCALLMADGRLALGTDDGLVRFDPEKLVTGRDFFSLAITGLDLVSGKPCPPVRDGGVTLRYNQNFFNIEYAALEFAGAENIKYAYRLEGLESRWNHVGQSRRATYTNLAPGRYTFKLMASKDSAFTRDDPMRTLQITVLPPWWLTVWAKIFYFLAGAGLLALVMRALAKYYDMRNRAGLEAELQETKLRFFTNISHELRTPMTLIAGPVERLLGERGLSEGQRSQLEYIDKNVRKLLGMVNQILDFRKVQNEKMQLNPSRIDLVGLAGAIFNNMAPGAQEKGLDFSFSTNAASLRLDGDVDKLEGIIQNLLSNAIKFTEPGGSVSLALVCRPEKCEADIVVSDTGVGIGREMMPRLFDCFSSLDNAAGQRGTGIGLYLVKTFTDMHGGDIAVDSQTGRGSVFTVTLPCPSTENPAQEQPLDDSLSSILVVDDNPELLSFVEELLRGKFRVATARNGAEALESVAARMPDMILSDLMMPVMDGIELLGRIRGDNTTSHIPFVLLSARNSVEDQVRGLEYGADDYIGKPFSPKLLISRITGIFERRSRHYADLTRGHSVVELAPAAVVCPKRDEELLRKVIRLIEDDLREMNDFSIDNIARAAGLSRTVFYKKIKSLTGLSPVELVRDIRLKRAAQLVSTRQYTVSEISNMVGFSDVRYFSRCFRRKYGVNPSDYTGEA